MGDDPRPATHPCGSPGEHHGHLVGLGRGLGLDDAQTGEHSGEYPLRHRHRPGVSGHQTCRPVALSESACHDPLAACPGRLDRIDEHDAVADGLQHHDDHVDLIDGRNRGDRLTEAKIGLIPRRH